MPVKSSIPLLTSVLLVSTPDPSLLALAVVTTTVGSLHDTGCAIRTLVVAVLEGINILALVQDHNEDNEDGSSGHGEESRGSHGCWYWW